MITGTGVVRNRFIEYTLSKDINIITLDIDWNRRDDTSYLNGKKTTISENIKSNKDVQNIFLSPVINQNSEKIKDLSKSIEEIVKENCRNYTIVRISNILGNSSFCENYLDVIIREAKAGIYNDQLENELINFLNIDDLFYIVHEYIKEKNKAQEIIEIKNKFEVTYDSFVSQIKAYISKNSKNESPSTVTKVDSIDNPYFDKFVMKHGIEFGESYLENLLAKHYYTLIGEKKKLSVVVPTYYQEEGVEEFYRRMKFFFDSIDNGFTYELIFVNDGSTDKTFESLQKINLKDNNVKIVNFSKNFGNQIAIAAGLSKASGDVIVIIDDDLQDPPEVITNLLSKWRDGFKVIYGVRLKRDGVGLTFKLIANLYYRFLDRISDIKIPVDTGDFRLMDKVIVDNLKNMQEENLYYRGMVPWIGFSQIGWEYNRDAREVGTTGFTFTKYFSFALSGITSFSEKPLYFSSYAGFFITIIGFLFGIYLIGVKIFTPGTTIRGWTSMVAIIIFFGGVQLISIGTLGIYLSKVYREVKRRPRYIISDEVGF